MRAARCMWRPVCLSACLLIGSQLKAVAAFAILQTFTVCLLMVVVAIFGEGAVLCLCV